MHFTTLFILRNETLDNVSRWNIEDMFCERFCYCCGESRPMYQKWCDWFQVGGRWCDCLKATKGIAGERSWFSEDEEPEENHYSIVEVKDLLEPIDEKMVYAIATKSKIYLKEETWQWGNVDKEKFDKLLNDINTKKFKGVIAFMDCHD